MDRVCIEIILGTLCSGRLEISCYKTNAIETYREIKAHLKLNLFFTYSSGERRIFFSGEKGLHRIKKRSCETPRI